MQQLNLFDDGETWETENDWETPNNLARFIASLVKEERRILCPGAGRGQIEKYLTSRSSIFAIEINPSRYLEGLRNCPYASWACKDFLSLEPVRQFDAAVFNPPFSLGIDFIQHSLDWLDLSNPNARCLVILPIDFFCAVERAKRITNLNCHIHNQYPVVGRVAFLKNGIPEGKPKRYHAVFDVRPLKSFDREFKLTWI